MDEPARAFRFLRKWAADGTWEKVFTALLAQADAEGDLDWVIAVDSTIVHPHQHAAGARQKAGGSGRPWPGRPAAIRDRPRSARLVRPHSRGRASAACSTGPLLITSRSGSRAQ
ncbi:hypothetical protein [Streptomyces sp. NBC_01233]|uniref:hypothetical protein n=1 Tax=Streptomyces sp. NBC_01233 TaxID=2903787 RepID=UPI002E118728|nr:hypothetical protein OG332_01940 [Streptomyces sp. NBC_01233]